MLVTSIFFLFPCFQVLSQVGLESLHFAERVKFILTLNCVVELERQSQSFFVLTAVLVWLNYKNAYEYWTEQRLALNKEVQTATQQVMDRLPNIASTQQQALSTLFLQLTVDDIGLCLPISPFTSFVSNFGFPRKFQGITVAP